jgi:glycosyltransferase involved in cell wall biosynthesis
MSDLHLTEHGDVSLVDLGAELELRLDLTVGNAPIEGRVLIVSLAELPTSRWMSRYCTDLAEYLATLGAQVRVLMAQPNDPASTGDDGAQGRAIPCASGCVEVVQVTHSAVRVRGHALAAVSDLVNLLAVRRSATEFAPDAVVACMPSPWGGALGAAAARRLRVPCVTVVHELASTRSHLERGWVGKLSTTAHLPSVLERSAFRRSVRITVPSAAFVPVVEHAAPGATVDVVSNWLRSAHPSAEPADRAGSATRRAAMRRRLGWDDRFVIAHVGAIGPRERLHELAPTLHHLAVAQPDVLVSFIGEGSRRPVLAEATTGLTSVEIRDPLPRGEHQALLQAADVLLVHEGSTRADLDLPTGLASYFAAGRPVLAVTSSGSPTALELERSRAGVTVPPLDASAFASRVSALRDDPRELDRMSSAGMTYARDILRSARSLSQLARVIGEVLEVGHDGRAASKESAG